MAKLYMLRGLPGCGKSTRAFEMLSSTTRPMKRINNDDLRAMIDGGKWSKTNEVSIRLVREKMIHEFLGRNYDVIVDNLNLRPQDEATYRQLAATNNAQFEVLDMTDVPLHVCVARDRQRAKPVGEKVIWKWWEQYIKPTQKQTWEDQTDLTRLDTIICDLDGTIADFDGKRSHFDYTKVYGDKLVGPVAQVIRSFVYSDWPVFIHFLSGREDSCFVDTQRWLIEKAGMPGAFSDSWKLLMRKTGDDRPDTEVKREIYEREIAPKYRVLFALDDRPVIVKLWRSMGIYTFDCGLGIDF